MITRWAHSAVQNSEPCKPGGCSDHDSSVFETTIRVVGGLLAAHDLSGDAMFARRCGSLWSRLCPGDELTIALMREYLGMKLGRRRHAMAPG
jgi:Glycosyl hydrolase family 47